MRSAAVAGASRQKSVSATLYVTSGGRRAPSRSLGRLHRVDGAPQVGQRLPDADLGMVLVDLVLQGEVPREAALVQGPHQAGQVDDALARLDAARARVGRGQVLHVKVH